MKRVLWAMFLISTFSLAAMAAPKKKFLNDGDADSTITLDQSTVAVIELWSNPSTGYTWVAQEPYADNIEILGSDFESSEPDMKGAWGKERIYVVGTAKGESELVMQYRRPWIKDKAAVDTLKFNFKTNKPFKKAFTVPSSDTPIKYTPDHSDVGANLGLPTSFSWCDQGGCPAIRNQGNCGSCWSFATVGPMESMIMVNDGVDEVDLSEQYLVSCNSDGWGCNGGYWAHDYHESKKPRSQSEAGAVLEADFSYTGRDGTCGKDYDKAYQIDSWEYVCGNVWCTPTTAQLKQAIYDHGPLTVAVCANTAMSYYTGGVFTGRSCSSLNHGVILVGWDDSDSCWIMRNSWGASWGEKGYMRIGYGVSGIGAEAAYVTYKSSPDPSNDDSDDDDSSDTDDSGDTDDSDDSGSDPDADEITNGQTISDLSASADEWLYYYIEVPEGTSTLTAEVALNKVFGGLFSIYLRQGAKPTMTEYDNKTTRWKSTDSCTANSPSAGGWYIGIYGKIFGFSGASLTASYN